MLPSLAAHPSSAPRALMRILCVPVVTHAYRKKPSCVNIAWALVVLLF
jgi:hypothetical protein